METVQRDSWELSSIERPSVLDGEHQSYGAKQSPPRNSMDAGGARMMGRKRKSVHETKAAGLEKDSQRGSTSANRKSSSSQTPSPGPKRARTGKSADRQQRLARKSSSSDEGQRGSPQARRGPESSSVLDSFLSLCNAYKESVESKGVGRAIDAFYSKLEEQLTEMITTSKELRVVKRDNARVNLLIKKKRHKLLEAKYELVRAKQQVGALQKEELETGRRLADLRRGRTFLHGIRDLHTQYLAHRRAHPTEIEQYGASSLPALLLETKSVLRAEDNLHKINKRLEDNLQFRHGEPTI
ncbi:hypothetical protein NHX12_010983 [Muraenolepis orangiensis]|uniref:Centromere protein U n=1 Tax=Muraenolepis orangiensis TaxID=630683 RepID=A0A9Q0DEZ4_9TELE|nr:hypothetical protein NHX12_010983 [Muraenolepis orangiensis]